MSKLLRVSLAAAALITGTAFAAPVAPTYTTFSDLAGATYGGTGIPTDPSAITSYSGNGGSITLGLTAHQRYDSPALTNDGAGTFFAQTGVDSHPPSSAATPFAMWNIGFYVDNGNATAYTYKLYLDLDPGINTDLSALAPVNIAGSFQDSTNLGYAPAGAFDPTVAGQYSFALIAFSDGVEVARSAINVQVGQVPEPASIALLALGLIGIAAVRRRKQ